MIAAVLVRFAYLAVSRAFAALWLLRMTEREKDVKILALRHQLAVLLRQLGDQRPPLRSEDGALLAALLVPLARATMRQIYRRIQDELLMLSHRTAASTTAERTVGLGDYLLSYGLAGHSGS
ncbi:hypothetical protein [Lentzea cavernae]|uniref:Uncharacterized protein n=1 Tax=Lentzea cavernae TaxID=2020703 RepID=A0ABQ3MEE4_9PSEU|nr:hypothetical protein [Lentzea cavernae]GHH42092.1 hypothetical protein GCM10017774_37770 [Lentzea cavernae]